MPPGQEESAYKAKISKVKLYEDFSLHQTFTTTHRLTPEAIATTALWAEQHRSIGLVLGDIPLRLFKYNVINSYTLTELERCFEAIAYRAFTDGSPFYEAALLECPDLILSLSDEYMAAVVNKLSETHRNIMVICGFGQTRSIPHYLYYSDQANAKNSVGEVARHRKVYENLLRKDNPEMQTDKLVIIDQILSFNVQKTPKLQLSIDSTSQELLHNFISREPFLKSNNRYDDSNL